MRKRIIVGVIATLVLGGGAAIALADSSEQRVASKPAAAPAPLQKKLGKVNQQLSESLAARVSCRSLGCINRTLNRLTRAVRVLNRDVNVCERFIRVTRYDGYLYSNDGGANVFLTTALDNTEAGDRVSHRVLVYVC